MDLNALPGQFYGTELRRLREHHGWSQSDLAERTGYSDALVGYLENAHRVPTERFTAACDTAFDTGTYLSRLCGLARSFGAPNAPLAALLRVAAQLHVSDPMFVPELAQTDDYARALLHAVHTPPGEVDALVEARPRLTDLLAEPAETRAWLALDQTALYRPVGSPGTLRQQLKQLLVLVDTGRVIVQILPTASAAGALLRVPVTLLTFPDGTHLAHLPGTPGARTPERYGDADEHQHVFDLLRATAWSPGRSRGAVATAIR